MKTNWLIKLFTIIIVFLNYIHPAYSDVMPYYTGAIKTGTIGFLKINKSFNLYAEPKTDSEIIQTIKWSNHSVDLKNKSIEPSDFFTVFVPEKDYAYCMVIDTQDNWYKIIYEKSNDKTGWINASESDFWTLKEFYSYYGKKHGLFYMKNVDYKKRGLYSGAYNNSQKLGGFTYIKNIKLNKISGNWALVTILDIENKPKIGYIKWREDDGSIIIFPKMDK